MDNLRSYFWYSLLSLNSCCELVLDLTDKGEVNIMNMDKFYNEYDEKGKKGINTSEKARVSVIKRTLSLCSLMASYDYYPDDHFYYMTNDKPGCELLIYVPSFSVDGNAENITAFIHFVYSAPFYTTVMEDVYLQQLGCSESMVVKLKSRMIGLNELCDFFSVDMSESLLLYRKLSRLFDVYKEDRGVKDLASVLWGSYVSNTSIYKDEVRNVSVERRMTICINLSRYLLRGELRFIENTNQDDQIKIMTLIVVSRDASYFPVGFK